MVNSLHQFISVEKSIINSRRELEMAEDTKAGTKERLHYIRVSNLNIENSRPLFVGPFKKEKDAEDAIQQAMYDGQELFEGAEYINNKTLNVEVVGGTAAKREGMREPLSEMPVIDSWEKYFAGGDVFKSKRGRPKASDSTEELEEQEEVVVKPRVERTETPRPTTSSSKPVTPSPRPTTISSSRETIKRNGKRDNSDVVIVSTNLSTISWLGTVKGYEGASVLSYVSHPSQIEGKKVIGVVPVHLICHAAMQGIIYIPGMKKEDPALTPEEITKRGGRVDWYETPKFKYSE
jgi:hypothetical protein